MMTNKFTVYMPVKHKNIERVAAAVRAITEKCGGMTGTPSMGVWYNAEGAPEWDELLLMTWWHNFELEEVRPFIIELVLSLQEAGEHSVMVEQQYQGTNVADIFGHEEEG